MSNKYEEAPVNAEEIENLARAAALDHGASVPYNMDPFTVDPQMTPNLALVPVTVYFQREALERLQVIADESCISLNDLVTTEMDDLIAEFDQIADDVMRSYK